MTIVLYRSKYGSTKQYAQWIAEAVEGVAMDAQKCKKRDLAQYDTVIFGTHLLANKMVGIDFLHKNKKALSGKKIATFAVGFSLASDSFVQHLAQKNAVDTKLFYLRGGVDIPNMKSLDKSIIKGVVRTLTMQPPENLSASDLELIQNALYPVDFKSKTAIQPIIEYIKE